LFFRMAITVKPLKERVFKNAVLANVKLKVHCTKLFFKANASKFLSLKEMNRRLSCNPPG
ncbi:MAG TPA: hypothetical protein VEV15_07880, partial [Flavisolibacter sp.]|nr:hypothetical protein [Flavisolibacter sp.]